MTYKQQMIEWKRQREQAITLLLAEIELTKHESDLIKKKQKYFKSELKSALKSIKYAEKEIKNCGQDNATGI